MPFTFVGSRTREGHTRIHRVWKESRLGRPESLRSGTPNFSVEASASPSWFDSVICRPRQILLTSLSPEQICSFGEKGCRVSVTSVIVASRGHIYGLWIVRTWSQIARNALICQTSPIFVEPFGCGVEKLLMFLARPKIKGTCVRLVHARSHTLPHLILKFNVSFFDVCSIDIFDCQFGREILKVHISLLTLKLTLLVLQVLHLLIFNTLNCLCVFAGAWWVAHLSFLALLRNRFGPGSCSLTFLDLSVDGRVMTRSERLGKEFILRIISFHLICTELFLLVTLQQFVVSCRGCWCLFRTRRFLLHMDSRVRFLSQRLG